MNAQEHPLKFNAVFYQSLAKFFGLGIVLTFVALELALRIHSGDFSLRNRNAETVAVASLAEGQIERRTASLNPFLLIAGRSALMQRLQLQITRNAAEAQVSPK